jgi:hypothetical protein
MNIPPFGAMFSHHCDRLWHIHLLLVDRTVNLFSS